MKRNYNENIDEKIINCLNYKAEKISAPDDMLFKVRNGIRNSNNKKVRFFNTKTIIAIGLLCVAITAPVAASKNNMHWFSTQNENSVNQFPTAETVRTNLGYLPKYAETFEGGFKVKSFKIIDNTEQNDISKKSIGNKAGEFEYTRDGSNQNQYLKVTVTNIDKEYFYNKIKVPARYKTYKDKKIYWGNLICRDVPNSYIKTTEDIYFAETEFDNLFTGNYKGKTYTLLYAFWYEDGMTYMISSRGYNDVNLDKLLNMSKKIIDQ